MCSVRFYPRGDRDLLLTLASQHWDLCEYSQAEFSKLEYLRVFDTELSLLPMYVAFHEDKPCGIVILSEPTVDIHMSGLGVHIMGTLSLRQNTVRYLFRAVRDGLGGLGVKVLWFSVPKRSNQNTVTIKYRRL